MQRPEERPDLIPFATGGLQDAKLASLSGCSSSSSPQRVAHLRADEVASQSTTEAHLGGKLICAIGSPAWRPYVGETQWVARTRVHLCRY